MNLLRLALCFGIVCFLNSCQPKNESAATSDHQPTDLSFKMRKVADSVNLLWAHTPADVTNDGIADLVFIENNGSGGSLGYFKGSEDTTIWLKEIVAQIGPQGMTFALGDMECADIDFDGDIDIIAAEHPGEWDNSDTTSILYWFENPGWTPHLIGETPDFIKDFNLVDFNNDRKMDLVALTFEHNTISIFMQEEADKWSRSFHLNGFGNLHEGMGTGNFNDDEWVDIVANGHLFINPGNSQNTWQHLNLDPQWNSQTGDWSRNGSKIFVRDLDEDGIDEIFVSHSERPGYPVNWYKWHSDSTWRTATLVDSLAACHTLQVFDFNLDGFYDVLAGVNRSRAQDLGLDQFPVQIFLGSEGYQDWTSLTVIEEGIYNGQAIDYDQDGDLDIIRYPTHDAKEVYLLENLIRD